MAKGYLTTHVLNTAQGIPAEGIRITAYAMDGDTRVKKAEMATNHDGRTDSPLLPEGEFPAGDYLLEFHVGDYIRRQFPDQGEPFFSIIPVPFHSDDGDAHYHVPLLLSPYGYSTYRGS